MDKKAFGKQIQKYRNRSGYSQEKLAELMDAVQYSFLILNAEKKCRDLII